MKQLFERNTIYESAFLQDFLLNLETKYTVEKANNKYKNLVNFSQNKDMPYHQWFSYREGFSYELIYSLLKGSGANPKEVIIDPFCGSGTTNVVAALNGFNTLGLDVNPMSSFITKAKTTHYSEYDLNQTSELLKEFSNNSSCSGKYNLTKPDVIKRYFSDNNYNSLKQIKFFLDRLEESKAKTILHTAFISIIIDSSNRKRDGNGLKYSQSKIDNVFAFFEEKVLQILSDLESTVIPEEVKCYGIHGSATNLYEIFNKLNFDTIAGAIIFSPPYANSFDYFESYKLELIMGGFVDNLEQIRSLRKKAIRSFVGTRNEFNKLFLVDLIAKEIENAIPKKEVRTGKTDHRTRKVPNMLKGYFSDMRSVLIQCNKTLNVGKKVFIVVDQSSYLGKIVPTDLILAFLAEEIGFKVKRIIECRKARTSTQQLKEFPYLQNGLRESIIVLQKK